MSEHLVDRGVSSLQLVRRESSAFVEGWAALVRALAQQLLPVAPPAVPPEVAAFYVPGNVVFKHYWQSHDRVLSLDADGRGGWSVLVEEVRMESDGKGGAAWRAIGRPRRHCTRPERLDRVVHREAEGVRCYPTDFMLMGRDADGRLWFKNVLTRNYLVLQPDGELWIPATGEAYMQGIYASLGEPEGEQKAA